MGSSSSPGVAGQGVAALMQDLLKNDLFQGRIVLNNVTNHLPGKPYRPDWPEDRIVVNEEDVPVPLIVVWVDNFLVHAAT